MDLERAVTKIIKKAYGEEVEVIEFEIESGTKKGENFGSNLLFITTTIKEGNQNEKKLSLVTKSLPPTEMQRKIFNVKMSFPKEAAFYQRVVPEYIKLQKESGFSEEQCTDAFPRFIGALFGPGNEVDEDTTLLMENLKTSGYCLGPRLEGIDLEHCKLVLKEIAMFHALGLALKRRKPDVFESVIKEDAGVPFKRGADIVMLKEETTNFQRQLLDYIKTLDECAEYVPRLSSALESNFFYSDAIDGYVPTEPFCTFVHNDLWVNNLMFRYDESGSPESLKLIDFQTCKIGSPVHDISHFIYLSASLDVINNNFEELLRFYHDHFCAALERLAVASEEFNWKDFCKELEDNAQKEAMLVLCLLRIAKMEHSFDEVSLGTFAVNGNERAMNRHKLWHTTLILDFARRGWI